MKTYKRLEILIALKIFNFEGINEDSIKYQKSLKAGVNKDEKIEAWYDEFAPDDIKKIGRKISGLLKSSTRIITFIAFLLSIGAAGLLFQYDGTTPVNVLPILGLFVFLPLLLLIMSFLLPFIYRDSDSDMKFLNELFEWIKARAEAEISKHVGQDDETIKARINEGVLIFSDPVQLFFKKTLQRSAAAYALGIMLWMLFNVTTTDLAFSWSSTLQFEAETIYKVTEVMSAPWAWIISSSTVDLDTVKNTRFFRADRSDISDSSSGHWWTFLFMSIVFYSLVPRLVTYFFYKKRFEKSLTLALHDVGYDVINLNRSIVALPSDGDKSYREYDDPVVEETDALNSLRYLALLWFMSEVDEALVENFLEGSAINIFSIGGTTHTKDDIKIAAAIANESASNGYADVYVLVKIWENPNLRFDQMIKMISKKSLKSRIIIIPVVDTIDDERLKRYLNIWEVRVSTLKSETGLGRVHLKRDAILNINKILGQD